MVKLKKVFLLIFVFILIFTNTGFAINSSQKNDTNFIEDYAGILKAIDTTKYNERLKSLKEKYGIPVYLYTINEEHNYKTRDLADEILYQRVGLNNNGIVLLIDMKYGQVYINSSGKAIDIMDDKRKEDLLDEIAPKIRNNPESMLDRYINIIEEYFEMGVKAGNRRVEEKSLKLGEIILALALGIIGFAISYFSINGTSKEKPRALTYPLLFAAFSPLMGIKDNLIDTKTRYIPIPRSNKNDDDFFGGSQSTTHTSSRGGTYSGSGRSF